MSIYRGMRSLDMLPTMLHAALAAPHGHSASLIPFLQEGLIYALVKFIVMDDQVNSLFLLLFYSPSLLMSGWLQSTAISKFKSHCLCKFACFGKLNCT